MAQFNEEKQIKDLQAIRTREEEALVQQTAQKIGVQYIDLTGIGVDTDALKIVSEKEARNIEIAPFKLTAKELHLATRSPLRQATQTKIKELEDQGYNVTTYMVSQKSLAKAWDRYKDVSLAFQSAGGLLDISDASLQKIANDIKTNEDVKKMFEDTLEEKMAHKVSRLMEILFGAAIATGASDIHIEAQVQGVRPLRARRAEVRLAQEQRAVADALQDPRQCHVALF
jgi:type II secretory ATPase GspE/PulE/Tfp pilus assembly ATPase PilB-like protein